MSVSVKGTTDIKFKGDVLMVSLKRKENRKGRAGDMGDM
jgi:hypothetical protein